MTAEERAIQERSRSFPVREVNKSWKAEHPIVFDIDCKLDHAGLLILVVPKLQLDNHSCYPTHTSPGIDK